MRTNNTISTKVTHAVNDVVHICTYHALIRQIPKESTSTTWVGHHHLPIVGQSSTMTSVIQTMQELCWHENLWLAHILLCLTI